MFEKEAEEYAERNTGTRSLPTHEAYARGLEEGFQDGAEVTLRKVIKYFSNCVLDENCGGYFSHLLESEEKLQELAKELENV